MEIKKYQPTSFTTDQVPCSCDSNDSQPVQDGDISQFQVKLDVCDFFENLIINGDFDDAAGTGWTLVNFGIAADLMSAPTGSEGILVTDTNILSNDSSYELEIDIISNSGEPLLVYFGTNKIAEIITQGKYVLSGKALTVAAGDVLKIISPKSNAVVIERIALYPLETNFALLVLDLDNLILDSRTLAEDVADSNYTFFKVDRDVVTVSFDWDYITDAVNGLGLTYGCYRLALMSSCTNTCGQMGLVDGAFDMPIKDVTVSSFPWSAQSAFIGVTNEVNTGVYTYKGGVGATVGQATVQDASMIPCVGIDYTVTMIIDTLARCSMYMVFGGQTSPTYTTPGTKVWSFTASGLGVFNFYIQDTPAVQGDVVVSDISIVVDNEVDKTPDFTSNVYDFKASHPCTVVVAGANNEDAFGLRFESAFFTPKFRYKGQLRAEKFPSKIDSHVNGLHKTIVDFFRLRKTKTLRLQDVPEYLVDWLATLTGYNKIYVDNTEYVADDEIDADFNRFCDTAKVEIVLGELRQNLLNVNKKGLNAITDIDNNLVRVFDEQEPIILIDGDDLALNG